MSETAYDRLARALAGRYALESEIGAGGMATVYGAIDLKHHRKVAIKVLRPDLAAALGAERFLQEIETTANLRHPHILPLYDSGQAGGRADGPELLYYVMPLVEGESLRERLNREKQLPLDDALQIAREVADALSYAHARGIIHRDIKPENILLESGHAVVADFGIARAVSAAGVRLTATGMSVGTPMYMSPEQAAGAVDLDGRSDLYSLACVLYEMLSGQPPFTGPTAANVVHQHLTVAARPISQLRPAVPPAIADVLARALAKNPADRFSPAAHFATALSAPPPRAPAPARAAPSRTILGLAAVTLAAIVATIVLLRASGAPALTVGRTTQATREAGLEVDPSLSHDGSSLAYASGPSTAMQIQVRQVGGGRPIALTGDTTGNFRWPRWSPDDKEIAYQSNDGIHVVPALGGAPRLVARISSVTAKGVGVGSFTPVFGLDWSPDGARIAWATGYEDSVITIATLATGETRHVPAPLSAFAPAWSPDGKSIAVAANNPAFIFGTAYFGNAGASEIWIVHLDGTAPTRVTVDSAMNVSPQWAPDGRTLYWISDREGSRDVYGQPIRNGAPSGPSHRLTVGADAQGLSVRAGKLAYSRLRTWSSIWSLPVPAQGPVSIREATRVTTGNETIEDVDVSPDGQWLVFDSDRNGNVDLYVMPAAGGEARQITTDPAGDYSADWSPDGRRIVFHSLRGGTRDIFTVESDGTGLRQWTVAGEEELDPDWSPDGERVVFEVYGRRHGFSTLRLVDGAQPEFIPSAGDFAHWSPDAKTIVRHQSDGLRARRVDAGQDTLLVSNAADQAEAFYLAWAPDGRRMYYLTRSARGWTVRVAGAPGEPGSVLVNFDDPTRLPTKYGFCTDGNRFYFTIGSPESDIFVVDLVRK